MTSASVINKLTMVDLTQSTKVTMIDLTRRENIVNVINPQIKQIDDIRYIVMAQSSEQTELIRQLTATINNLASELSEFRGQVNPSTIAQAFG